ncbi:hypothetical protein [Niallia circulans]|uniref:hypothetical protein n=1 Tax=Niallia circulans TaxID=1397 RepID=UPI003523FDC0
MTNKGNISLPVESLCKKGVSRLTINTVVFIPEGIVVAADSRLSGLKNNNGYIEEFYLNDNMEKVMLLNSGKVGITYNGHSDYLGKTIPEIIRDFDRNQISDVDTVTDIAFKLFNYFSEKYKELNTSFSVIGYIDSEQYIYSLNQGSIKRVNINYSGLYYGIFCSGNVEIAKVLNPINKMYFEEFNLVEAIKLAEFYINTTIDWLKFNEKYANCGGPIDILVMKPDKSYFYRDKFTESLIKKLDEMKKEPL